MSALELRHERVKGGRVKVTAMNGEARFIDTLDPASERSRSSFVKKLGLKIGAVNTDEDRAEVNAYLMRLAESHPASETEEVDLDAVCDRALAAMPDDIVEEARAMLMSPDLVDLILKDLRACGIVGESDLALTIYQIGTSRLLKKPLAGIVQGATSTGKSFVIDRVAELFPEEAVLRATDMTPNALYYLPTGSLRHRFIVAGERSRKKDDDRAESTRALREMIASRILRKMLPEKMGDRMETRVIENPGPISYVESTTIKDVFEEDANRMLLLKSDESKEQTRLILDAAGRA